MRNSFGFGKFEVLTVIVLLLIIVSILGYITLGGVSEQKISTMKDSALSFSRIVGSNISSFHNVDTVYLEEAIKEKVTRDIKNPFGFGNCDGSQSFVHFENGSSFVTLKCGHYLIDNAGFNDMDKVDIYKVSDWSTEKTKKDNIEERKLYNCKKNGKQVYEDYTEELYFVFKYNYDYHTDYYFANDVDDCEVQTKTFYRQKTVVNS